jgi:peptidoglycan/xylan/chitin deacetylase (PgdA/CDA1 family)
MKHFIITIDTEGDNLWEYRMGDQITTQNARYIPRFQELCNKYNYKPVYLTNYEMANDSFFVNFLLSELDKGNVEVGLHLHAWNNPPNYDLPANDKRYGQPYLIEYPVSIMRQKIEILYAVLRKKFNTDIVSHRAGRWAMNQDYFDVLAEYGLKIDCSVTPHVSWENAYGLSYESRGSDYTTYPENPYIVKTSSTDILEIPVTIRRLHIPPRAVKIWSFLLDMKKFITGKTVWLRPNGNNLQDMLSLINTIQRSDTNYLMFMLHSSELMPGGSPTFKTAKSIEYLYRDLEIIFNKIAENFKGITIKDYYESVFRLSELPS